LKEAIKRLQEDLNTQKIIAETVSEENRKLKLQIEDLKKRQSDLKEKVDKMTTMFQETFGRFGERLKRGQLTNLKKAKTEKKRVLNISANLSSLAVFRLLQITLYSHNVICVKGF
jgi:inner membrane protein involved in colicin E2 resistance